MAANLRGVNDSRPELQLGFKAMRRVEILRYIRQHGVDMPTIREDIAKDDLIKMADTYVTVGKLPDPSKANRADLVEMQALNRKIQDQQVQIDRLEAMIARMTGAPAPAAVVGPEVVAPPPPPPPPPRTLDEILAAGSIAELRAAAKDRGINCFGKSKQALAAEIKAKIESA